MLPVIAMSQPYSNPATVDLGAAGNYRALAGTALSIGAGCTVNGNVGVVASQYLIVVKIANFN
jgi:hypothetical protein